MLICLLTTCQGARISAEDSSPLLKALWHGEGWFDDTKTVIWLKVLIDTRPAMWQHLLWLCVEHCLLCSVSCTHTRGKRPPPSLRPKPNPKTRPRPKNSTVFWNSAGAEGSLIEHTRTRRNVSERAPLVVGGVGWELGKCRTRTSKTKSF